MKKIMTDDTKIINGKQIAEELCEDLKNQVIILKEKHNITPGLTVILVGEDPASQVYVSNKDKKANALGIRSNKILLDKNISQEKLLSVIDELNNDKKVNGILVQLPLPEHIDKSVIINAIDPNKDVDGFHLVNTGKLYTNQESLVPCTPQGCQILLKRVLGDDLSGLNAVVIGRSNIVGKPMAELLLQDNCTTTIIHSRSKNAESICRKADIIVAAVGKANFVKENWVKEGAVIIDVGINRINIDGKSKLVGDVDFDSVINKSSAVTPVPGGVGPMTIACLMGNTIQATMLQYAITI